MLLLAFTMAMAGVLPGGSPAEAQDPGPSFHVDPGDGWIGAPGGWLPAAPITVTFGDPADPDHSETFESHEGGGLWHHVDYDIEVGEVVTVTDGVTTKSHTVVFVSVDVDQTTHTATGEANPGVTVRVQVIEFGRGAELRYEEEVVADGDGAWSVDLGAAGFEVEDHHHVWALVFDADGDATRAHWLRDSSTIGFPDVPVDHPFHDEIAWLVVEGITTGFEDGTFRPTNPVTRQAAAAFLYRLAGEPPVAGVAGFSDVPVGHRFHDEIAWLVAEGITTGFEDGTFRPTNPVTRQAAAAFLYRLAGGLPVTGAAGFPDVPSNHPFHDEIAWLVAEGITTGWPDNTFRPTNRVTRQAMAAFLYRFDAAIENRVAFTGLILDEDTGLPISGAPLLCISSEVWTAESDEEGRYACTGLPEGEYVLVLYVDGYQPRSFGPFLYDGAEPVEVDLPLVPMTVHPDVIGTVTDAVSGAVVAGAEIAVFWEDGGERWPSVPSDEEGAYSLRRVDRDREFRLRVAGPWQFEPWIGWEHPDIHVTDIYVYDGGEPLVIDIAITAP